MLRFRVMPHGFALSSCGSSNSPSMDRILVVRTDRLGDVLLTTPVSSALRKAFPEAKITWLVRSYAAPLLENNPDIDGVMIDHGGSTGELVAQLKKEHFDAAIV